MIEPQGPLPPEIYWRRRAVAAGGGVLIVGLVVALIVWLTSGGGEEPQNTAAAGDVSTSASTSEPAPLSEAPASESDAPSGGGAGGGGEATPVAPPASGGQAPSESASPAGTPGEGGGPAGPALCPDQAISVVLYTDKPTYTIGQQPVFTIVTTNAGLTECTRDVGKAAQNVTVRTLDGTRTLWSARDCSPVNTVNNVVLKPAQQVKDTITWSGTTSSPGCQRPRTQIPAGSYSAVGKIGERESFPITFNFVAPARQ